jgi:DNA-binding SARP family transcriptional activator
MLRLHTFGGCSVTRDGAPVDDLAGQRKALAFLAILAAAGERGISREKVLAHLWPESDDVRDGRIRFGGESTDCRMGSGGRTWSV